MHFNTVLNFILDRLRIKTMLNLKDYGSSSSDDEQPENASTEKPTDSALSLHELSKKFAVNAAPDVLPPVRF